MNTNMDEKTMQILSSLRDKVGPKCCWTNSEYENRSMSKYFSGFARIIEYADYQRGGASPEYAFKITEG